MKYYVIRIITTFDNKETRNIMPFDTRDEAEIRYHNSISADMSNEDVMKTLVLVLNSEGGIEMSKNWKAETPLAE